MRDLFHFLGFDFQPLQLNDQEVLEPFLQRHPQRISGYTFACLAAWNGVYRYAWCMPTAEVLLVACCVDSQKNRHLIQPIGRFSLDIQEKLLQAFQKLNYPIKMYGMSQEFIDNQVEWVKHFIIQNERGAANYIYRTKDLAELAGHKYAKKRNLLSQAEQQYAWTLHELTPQCGPECMRILEGIGQRNPEEMTESLKNERIALELSMQNFGKLHQQGCMIKVSGKPVAFSIFEKQSEDTAVIHFEKAEREYKGLYQLINRETAKKIDALGFTFLNREEDLDVDGLRQAKQSYFPIRLESVYHLQFNRMPTI